MREWERMGERVRSRVRGTGRVPLGKGVPLWGRGKVGYQKRLAKGVAGQRMHPKEGKRELRGAERARKGRVPPGDANVGLACACGAAVPCNENSEC